MCWYSCVHASKRLPEPPASTSVCPIVMRCYLYTSNHASYQILVCAGFTYGRFVAAQHSFKLWIAKAYLIKLSVAYSIKLCIAKAYSIKLSVAYSIKLWSN